MANRSELVEKSFMPMVPLRRGSCPFSRSPATCAQARAAPRLYGKLARWVHSIAYSASAAVTCLVILVLAEGPGVRAAEPPVKIVALGDSLTAGFGLSAGAAFPSRLQA